LTLRNLWELAQYVDPFRLRSEFLNNTRNTELYAGDPLAPARYRPDTLFAMTMVGNPLGWFEVSNLPEKYIDEVAPLVKTWKRERNRLHDGVIVPIGSAPDGNAWTGFASVLQNHSGGYVLLFRELNDNPEFTLDLHPLFPAGLHALNLAGRGSSELKNGRLSVRIPQTLDYLWVRLDAAK
jgi:alpha-galactosidase